MPRPVKVLPATKIGGRILSHKVRMQRGLIIAARNPDLIGHMFPLSEELSEVWSGRIATILEEHTLEDRVEHALGIPLLEISSPIRADWTGEIIAVAERAEGRSVGRAPDGVYWGEQAVPGPGA